MDKAFAAKLLGGTVTRGVLWVAAWLATTYGIEQTIDEPTAANIGIFVAGIAVAAFSAWWSARKDKKLLTTDPTLPRH